MYVVRMSRSRRGRRKTQKGRRHAELSKRRTDAPRVVVREAAHVERLAYTRTQAATALGISRSTFIRRVLPFVETIETGWGTRLIPVDELDRFVAERRRKARATPGPPARAGRRTGISSEVIARVRREHAGGRSLGQIARGLNADGVPTSQGGRQWWPSTIRALLAAQLVRSVSDCRKGVSG
jgi:hypothetical protein